ncbi:MAG: phosphate/phosphite/phosphonate ABC transporter substrate-binding protein [Myxococcota bacterium]
MKGSRLLALVLLFAGCPTTPDRSPPAPRRPVATRPVFSPPAGFTRLRFGLVPFLSPGTMSEAHQRLGEYLSKSLGVPVEIAVGDSYGDSIERLARGEFDLVELSPLAYATAAERVKLNCLVQSIADGSATASGYIFVRDDSSRKTLEDLRGGTLGFVDPMSTSGYLYARKLLKDRGLDLQKDFARVEFLGNHEAVLLAVMEGRVDAGATYQGAFGALKRSKGVDPLTFRVVAKTLRTPRDIFCVRPEVPDEVAQAIREAMLALTGRDRAGREILGPLNINGFRVADDHAYDEVRAVAAELKPAP